jgi:ABC-type transport system involved in multi-copper enzyme maturation permease subunit
VSAVAETAPIRRPSLPRLSRVELRKMADTRAGFWLLAIVGLIAVAAVIISLAAGDADDENLSTLLSTTVALSSVLLPVVGILAVTSEWSQRTALATFTLVPERWRVMAAKIVAALVLGLLSVAACLVASMIGAAVAGGDFSLGASALGNAALYQLLSMLGGFALGALFLNSPLAIVMYFVIPTVVGILGELIDALPADWIDTSQTFSPLVENEMGAGDWSRLAVSTAIWILLPLVLGLLRLQRAEVKSS